MAIKFSEQNNLFVIETEKSTYMFALEEGALLSAYWGEKLNTVNFWVTVF